MKDFDLRDLDAFEAVEHRRTEFIRYREQPTETADGVRIHLQANVALGVDIALAKDRIDRGFGQSPSPT